MATFEVGNGLYADMANFDFSVLAFGKPTVTSGKRFVIELNDGGLADFRGKGFTYNRGDEFTAGDLQGFALYDDGAIVLRVAGTHVSAKAFIRAVETTTLADDLKIMSKMFAKDDIIAGGELTDALMGFKGNDGIYGGGSADLLTGGTGADHFIYLFADESFLSDGDIETRDYIIDFSQSQTDKIDLSEIGPIHFAGEGEFSGENGELRFFRFEGKTHVSVDMDGDIEADFSVVLNGEIALRATDFIL